MHESILCHAARSTLRALAERMDFSVEAGLLQCVASFPRDLEIRACCA
jgi:hypothetical protein